MLKNHQNSSFQKAIEIVESLSIEEQETLIEIIQNRLKQRRRDELIQSVKESEQNYLQGHVKRGSVADLMAELEE